LPITIAPPVGNPVIGPFVAISLDSEPPQVVPPGSTWELFVNTTVEVGPGQTIWTATAPATGQQLTHILFSQKGPATSARNTSVVPKQGDTMRITAELRNGATVLDTGQVDVPWDTQGNQWEIPYETSTQSSGLTPTQASQLEEVHGQTFLSRTIDQLTLHEITNGPTGAPVGFNFEGWAWGVIVRLTAVPGDAEPQTPDGDYWVRTLAVVRIYRGVDLWLRVPIHTSSKIIPFAEENVLVGVSALTPTQWALQLSLQAWFGPGVEGQIFWMNFP